MTKQDKITIFEKELAGAGWTKDRWGHWIKDDHRIKISKIVIRYEVKVMHLSGPPSWVRIRSAPIRDLAVNDGVTNFWRIAKF